MDTVTSAERLKQSLGKYKYVLLIFLAGVLLMSVSIGESEPAPVAEEAAEPLAVALSQLLSRIEGAGKVEVLLTEAAGEKRIYQTEVDISQTDRADKTVLVTDSQRNEQGLVVQVLPPEYLGAVILCQGADRASVRLSIVEAVMDVTGLTSDRITVVKMK